MTTTPPGAAQLSLPVVDHEQSTTERRPRAPGNARVRVVVPEATVPTPARRPRDRRRADLAVASQAAESHEPKPPSIGDPLLLTVPEAARALHIGRRQAWELVWRGELPVVRLGRSVRVARPVLERFVAERSLPYGA